jgi:hypothetical protein
VLQSVFEAAVNTVNYIKSDALKGRLFPAVDRRMNTGLSYITVKHTDSLVPVHHS